MAAMSPFLKSNRKQMGIHVGPPKLSLCTKFERNPVGVVRVTVTVTVCLHPRWPAGRHFE